MSKEFAIASMESLPENKPPAVKPPSKLRDLAPRKDAKGGSALFSKNPPLSIPPDGFVVRPDAQK